MKNHRSITRRDALGRLAGLTAASMFPFERAFAEEEQEKRSRVLFFTKSSGFEHPVIKREDGKLGHAEKVLIELGRKHGFDVEASKDGGLFDGDLSAYDAFFFYTSGDLTRSATDKQPPMSEKGKKALLDAVKGGKGFLGSHCASDSFHTPGDRFATQEKPDPFLAMLGGEFIRHGPQQKAVQRVVDGKFPGLREAGESFELHEEWYSLKNFAPDLHVILVQETEGMKGSDYQRPPYPATWARKHGDGRVFYTSMGHREDVWTNSLFQSLVLGAMAWATGRVDADVTPNIEKVTPKASVMPPRPER